MLSLNLLMLLISILNLLLKVKLLLNLPQFQCEPEEIIRNISEDSPPGSVIKMGYQKLQKSLWFYLTGSESDLFNVENNGAILVSEGLNSYGSDQVYFLVTFFSNFMNVDLFEVITSDLMSKFTDRIISSSRNVG